MQNSKIIFIGGVQRSGTTFLRNSLIKSSDICIPYENGFYKVLQKKYINGLNFSNCDQFLLDLYKVKRFEFWELDRMEVMNLLKSQIPIRFNDFVIELLNFYKSKHKPDSKIIGLKNPHVYNHIDYVQLNFSNPIFFLTIRDPRAIYDSMRRKNTKASKYNLIWRIYSRYKVFYKVHKKYVAEKNIYFIKYEDLIVSFEKNIRFICSELDVNFIDKNEKVIIPDSEYQKHNLSIKPPNKTRINIFLKNLSMDDISLLEFMLKKEIKYFNYKFYHKRVSVLNLINLIIVFFYGFTHRLKKTIFK